MPLTPQHAGALMDESGRILHGVAPSFRAGSAGTPCCQRATARPDARRGAFSNTQSPGTQCGQCLARRIGVRHPHDLSAKTVFKRGLGNPCARSAHGYEHLASAGRHGGTARGMEGRRIVA